MAEDDRLEWDRRWAAERDLPRSVPSWVAELQDELPTGGRGLDVAAGAGRMAVYMARRGLDVEAVDISPVGLALAREAARDEGLKLKTLVRDLTTEGLPEGTYDLIACFHYRQPGLFGRLRDALRPGGVVLAEVETARDLARSGSPETNELLRAAGELEIVFYREGRIGTRHLARLLARRR
jgi:2-polyprenyl-3-methyl-5-hydroxy-6-metoxy-1,4-benzoquinol methylase